MSNKNAKLTRRDFTKMSATALASIPFLSFQNPFLSTLNDSSNELSVHLFSKHLQFLNYNDMAEAAANIGFNGLDLTVRRKGHVLPNNVEEDLPKAVAAMNNFGLPPVMMSTNVWDANKKVNETVLKTASQLGFTHYRTDWLKYAEDKTIVEAQKEYAQQAVALERLNKKYGLIGGYQNHAGKHVGAPVWDLLPILTPTKGKNIGAQYDIRHAVVEGGESWELGLKRIKPYINSIVIKDFKWGKVNGKWKPVNVPLGEGMVDFKRYFTLLKKYKINVPVSLHIEHDLGGAEKGKNKITIPQKEVFTKMKNDLTFLRNIWKNAE